MMFYFEITLDEMVSSCRVQKCHLEVLKLSIHRVITCFSSTDVSYSKISLVEMISLCRVQKWYLEVLKRSINRVIS